jgi:hypothetical protein
MLYIYVINKCIEVVHKFGLEFYFDYSLKNLMVYLEL